VGLGRRAKVMSAAVGVATVGALLVPGGAAYGAVVNVAAGQSIQAAVNAASPGDTIKVASGTFRESVEVTKSLTILGAGQGSTIVQPPASAPANHSPVCQDPSDPSPENGFCIHGTFDQNMNVVTPVANVRVSGFTVKNFSGTGIIFFGASSPQVDSNTVLNNGEYGTAAFVSTNDRFTDNTANKNGEAGIYVGDSPAANAVVNNNQASNNANFGIFVRDASGVSSANPGKVTNNLVRGNCAGILFLDTGSGEAHWDGSNNQASANNAVCEGDEGPSAGGIGIAVSGPDDVKLHDNLVTANQPSGPVDLAGGIVVADGATNIAVTRNDAHRNLPDDLVWDQSGSATFTNNSCKTSNPAGLCH
jgi:parallel beta-helix repeat protein